EMTDEEYRALLRSTDAAFRRVLVFQRYTGCRPCEMRRLKWIHVDLDRCVAVLPKHKTSRLQKEPKPRVIPLAAPIVKLLRWLRSHRQLDPVEVLRGIVAGGPLRAGEYRRLVAAAGLPVRSLSRISAQAGIKPRRVGR